MAGGFRDILVASAVWVGAEINSYTFTADAVIKKTVSTAFSADAYLIHRVTATFSADAYLIHRVTATFSADAVVKKTVSTAFSADAYIVFPSQQTFTADAYLVHRVTATFTANAHILPAPYLYESFNDNDRNTSLWTVGGIQTQTVSGATVAETNYRLEGSYGADINAADRRATGYRSIHNYNLAGGGSIVFHVTFVTEVRNEFKVYFFDNSGTIDWYVGAGFAYFPGQGVAHQGEWRLPNGSSSSGAGSIISGFNANGGLWVKVEYDGAGTVRYYRGSDGINWTQFTFSANMSTVSWDSVGVAIEFERSPSSDVTGTPPAPSYGDHFLLFVDGTADQFTADAVIQRSATASFTADAHIAPAGVNVPFTADAIFQRSETATFTADAYILHEEEQTFTADAYIVYEAAAAFTADAIIQKTVTVGFSADAIIQKTVTVGFSADAVIDGPGDIPAQYTIPGLL